MTKVLDLVGQRFNKLTVLRRVENTKANKTQWQCLCDCGKTNVFVGSDLKGGKLKSCGCSNHGKSSTKLYGIWHGMKQRCYDENHQAFGYYGRKGVFMQDDWKEAFMPFYAWAMTNGYEEGLSIERINIDKGYTEDNCCWIHMSEQSKNRSTSRMITYQGKTMCINDWARETGVNHGTIRYRLKIGKSLDEVFKKKGKV